MDVSEYERIAQKMEMLEDLLEAKRQVDSGNIFTMDEAKERIENQSSNKLKNNIRL